MNALDVPVAGVGSDILDDFVCCDRSPPRSMMLSGFHGFLTAIAIGPERIMLSEWLPIV